MNFVETFDRFLSGADFVKHLCDATRPTITSQVAVRSKVLLSEFFKRKIRCNDIFFQWPNKIYIAQRNYLMTSAPMTPRIQYSALHTSLYGMFRKHSCLCFV